MSTVLNVLFIDIYGQFPSTVMQAQQRLNEMQRRYDKNKQDIKEIRSWINELRFKQIDDQLNRSINTASDKLRKLENGEYYGGDFGAYGQLIDEIRNFINLELEKFNDRQRSGAKQSYNSTPSSPSVNVDKSNFFLNLAQEYWKNNQISTSLQYIKYSLEENPNNISAYELRGVVHLYGQREYAKAVEDFSKIILNQGDNKRALLYRGMAFYNINKNMEAMKDFTSSLTIDNNFTDAYFMRGILKSDLNDLYGALSDYDEIIKREFSVKHTIFKMSTVYNNKAFTLVRLEKHKEALPLVEKALALDQSEGYIWDTRGEIFYKIGEFNKCISDMNKSLSINNKSQNSYLYRGLANIKIGKKEDGCRDLSKAGELGNEKAYEAISEFCK